CVERLRTWIIKQHAALERLFEERLHDGFVRECHGDLHLGNIALIDGRIRVFDCIEFNASLRWIDVMNEVAFLAMDLVQRQRSDFAYRFLDGYLQVTGDYRGLRLLRYYMVYRALLRAKVSAIRSAQAGLAPPTQESLQANCRPHIALAERLTHCAQPLVAIMHGLSGSGKSAVSQAILESLSAIRIRSDVERKRMHGMSATGRS